MFFIALFTIAKTWKQLKYTLAEEWIKKMWYIYSREYYSAVKKNEVMPLAATWMGLDRVMLSEGKQRVRDIIRHPLYVECKKK